MVAIYRSGSVHGGACPAAGHRPSSSPGTARVAGGTHSPYSGGVSVFTADGVLITSSDLGGGQHHRLVHRGLAWHPDGQRLYAITDDGSYPSRAPAQLHILQVGAE